LEETSEQAADKKTKLDNEGVPQPPVEEEEKHEVRILIDARQVGSVIGRGGSNVTRIRQECSVFMSILKAPEGVKERILTIKGHTENIAQACRGIGQILQEVQVQRAQKGGEEAKAEDSIVSFRFLVHQTRVGGVIGKGGSLVQSTQQSTGARVQVSVDPLGHSTEKSVTVSGTVDRVFEACKIVVGQIRANPLRAGVSSILYDPAYQPNDFNPFFRGHAPPHGYNTPQGYPYHQPQPYYPPQGPHSHPYSQPSYPSQPPAQPFNPYPPAYSGSQGGPGQATLSKQKNCYSIRLCWQRDWSWGQYHLQDSTTKWHVYFYR
jgi:ribosomal protein S3